jgi:hypothetical protein
MIRLFFEWRVVQQLLNQVNVSWKEVNRNRWPGVDVMITIFCDFRQFWAKKLAFFSKTNVMITIFAKTSFVLRQN